MSDEVPTPELETAPTSEQAAEAPEAPEAPEPQAFEGKYLSQLKVNQGLQRQLLKLQNQVKEQGSSLEKFQSADKLWDEDPAKALQTRGIDLVKLQQDILAGNDLTPEQKESLELKQRLETLEQERQHEREAHQRTQAQQAQIKLLDDIQAFYDESGEDFAYSGTLGARENYLIELNKYLAENGVNASAEEQAEMAQTLEQATRKQVHTQVETLVQKSQAFREYLQGLLQDATPQGESEQSDQQGEKVEMRARTKPRSKTITRDQQTAVTSRAKRSERSTREERMERLNRRLDQMAG